MKLFVVNKFNMDAIHVFDCLDKAISFIKSYKSQYLMTSNEDSIELISDTEFKFRGFIITICHLNRR